MEKFINVDIVFTKSSLLRIGDKVTTKIEFLNQLVGGFDYEISSGFIKEIRVEPTSLVNNCYSDFGLPSKTFEYRIILDNGNSALDFEVHPFNLYTKSQWTDYLKQYFNNSLNNERLMRLVNVLEIPFQTKCVVSWVKRNRPEVFQFMIDSFKLRFYYDKNPKDYSRYVLSVLHKYNLYSKDSIFYKLTNV